MSASTPARKAPPSSTSSGRNPNSNSPSTPGTASRTPARSSTPTNGAGSVQRTRSTRNSINGTPVSARAAVRKPGAPSTLSQAASQNDAADDDAREEAAAYLHELKERLERAENLVEEREKQMEVLNARLDDSLKEQAKLEERAHEEEEKVEALENEKRELTRQHRELESIYEAERAQTMKEKEEWQAKEEDLQGTIQRLKETLAMKDIRATDAEEGHLSRTSSFRNSRSNSSQNLETSGQFAPPSSIQRSDSRNNSKLIHQKDKIIEDLRLELAELQIKLMEMENMGGGRMRELEKQLLETRMTNARLMEDNESFQLLLSEKTLNGDFSRGDFLRGTSGQEDRAPSRNGPSTSLAEELESAEGSGTETIRRLENELNSMKDQNKALTLYINKIIERLLEHQGFESILDKTDLDTPGSTSQPNTNKELPPPPPSKENQQPSLLQRAKSVVTSGGGGRGKPRPLSYAPAPSAGPTTVNEDPSTAPSIPIQRSQSVRMSSGSYTHRRSNSEFQHTTPNPAAANVINNMYRNPQSTSGGPGSPGVVISPRNSFFGIPIGTTGAASVASASSRVPSSGAGGGAIEEEKDESLSSRPSSRPTSLDTPSPPRPAAVTGVISGRQMRPLRLVEAEEEATRARKAANRGSWISWFQGGEKGGAEHQQH